MLVDAVTFQIIRHKLNTIVDEGIIALENVSASPITTEGHDAMVSLYTSDGELMLAGVGFLHHVTSAAQAVKHLIAEFSEDPGIDEGDAWFFNDSYSGALHPPDVYMISPIHFQGELKGFVANFVHVTDIGAIDPGGFSPNARESYQEGFQTKGLKIVERGRMRKDAVETFLNMVRDPALVLLDLKSQLAANHVAKERMTKLFFDYGVETVETVAKTLIRQSEELIRRRLLELPDGSWSVREYVDAFDSVYKAELELTKEADTLTFDFTGSDPQAPIGINCSYWSTWGAIFAPFLPLLAWDMTWNEGVTRPVRMFAPEGTVVNAKRPAPISIATVSMINIVNNLATIVISKLLGASEQYKRRATAVWHGSHTPMTCHGTDAEGAWYTTLLTDGFCGSGGARSFADGVDLGGELANLVSRWANVEHHELRTPLLYLYRRIVPDSGGPGKYRGGLSHECAFTPHRAGGDTMGLVCYGKGSYVPMSLGLFGGFPGCHTAYTTFHGANLGEWPSGLDATTGEIEHKQWGSQRLDAGDAEYLRLQGGGGYGDPLDRDPEAVLLDVLDGKVTAAVAHDVYGVVEGNAAATDTCRRALRAERIGSDDLRPRSDVAPSGMRISEYLQRDADGNVQCTWCGLGFAPAGSDWKEHSALRTVPLSAPGPLRMEDGRFRLIESYCPGCATLLDVDLTHGEDGRLHDRVLAWPRS